MHRYIAIFKGNASQHTKEKWYTKNELHVIYFNTSLFATCYELRAIDHNTSYIAVWRKIVYRLYILILSCSFSFHFVDTYWKIKVPPEAAVI